MTGDLLDRTTREAGERLSCAGRPTRPRLRTHLYANAIMRLVKAGRREGEDFYDAYRRVLEQPTATLAALVLIHRDQFGRERRMLMH